MNISVTCQCESDLHSFISTLSFSLILDFCGCCKPFQHSFLPVVSHINGLSMELLFPHVALLLCIINSTFSVLHYTHAGFTTVGFCAVFNDPTTYRMGKEKCSRWVSVYRLKWPFVPDFQGQSLKCMLRANFVPNLVPFFIIYIFIPSSR